jgi:hypothetical protein
MCHPARLRDDEAMAAAIEAPAPSGRIELDPWPAR